MKYAYICLSLLIILIILTILTICISTNNTERFYHKDVWFQQYFDNIYVINLPHTRIGNDRWNRLQTITWLKPHLNRFPGVDGNNYDFSEVIAQKILIPNWDLGTWRGEEFPRMIEMSQGEMGCILSHYSLWKHIIANNIRSALILEDDAQKYSSDFRTKTIETMKNIPDDWDMVLFGFWLHRGEKGYPVNSIIYRVKDFALLHCYALSNKGAVKLINECPIDMPLDSWISKISGKLKIYRHTEVIPHPTWKYPTSRLIRQSDIDKHNVNTNNY